MKARRCSGLNTNLRRQAVADVQDGNVVGVGTLIHTKIWPQAVPQLHANTHTQRCTKWTNTSDPFHTEKPQRRRWIKITKNIFLPLSANGECVWKWPEAQLSFVFTMELLIIPFHKRMPIRKTALLALHCDKWNSMPWERKIILSTSYFYNSVLWDAMSSIRCSNVSVC